MLHTHLCRVVVAIPPELACNFVRQVLHMPICYMTLFYRTSGTVIGAEAVLIHYDYGNK